jgi:hypothetical protein
MTATSAWRITYTTWKAARGHLSTRRSRCDKRTSASVFPTLFMCICSVAARGPCSLTHALAAG